MKILIVEDDKTIASGLEYSLQQDGYQAVLCHDVVSAKEVLTQDIDQFALCLFDLQLPDGSGYELCKMVKERGDIPVIFLTVIDEEVNVVMGLDMGADDYITKPFRVRELLSRIKSVLRRYQKPSQVNSIIDINDIRINTLEGKVFKNGTEIALTALEYRLLLIFGNHLGQVLTRNQFAMLKSVGMTPKGFAKMMNYESVFYGIKSLLFGLPISFAVMVLIYKVFPSKFSYGFNLPWMSILSAIVAVFVIVGSAIVYSGAKVKKENIIEVLKQENI